jgi:hypothetical protein
MTEVEKLLELVSIVAKGKDRVDLGAVGFNGYGFVFRDPFNSQVSYITIQGSSKFCSISLLLKRNIFQQDFDKHNLKGLRDFMMENDNYNLLLASSLKTLIPTLKFGGDERLFFAWMFVRTPDGKQFPATFYYGQSGMSLGGWSFLEDDSEESYFPVDFKSKININPFEISREKLEDIVEALEHSLRKITLSDFYGVYKHDFGRTLMGVQYGRPFTMDLRRPMNDDEIKSLIKSTVF